MQRGSPHSHIPPTPIRILRISPLFHLYPPHTCTYRHKYMLMNLCFHSFIPSPLCNLFLSFLHPRVFLSFSPSCPCFKDSSGWVQSAAWKIRQTEGRTLIMLGLTRHGWIMCDRGDDEESVGTVSCRVQKPLNVDRTFEPTSFIWTIPLISLLFLNTSLLRPQIKKCLQNKVVG